MDIITGEKIQLLCDFFIGERYDLNFNPIIREVNDRHILLNSNPIFPDIQLKIFIYPHLFIKNIDVIFNILKNIKQKFIVVTHNSDGTLFEDIIKKLFTIDNLSKIYTQNINVDTTVYKNVIPLPFGFANSQWPHGNLKYINELVDKLPNKTNDIFFNFHIPVMKHMVGTEYFKKRNNCKKICVKKGIKWTPKVEYALYLKNLSTYKFAICPEGNGIDTHRLWECLYLKVIPICLSCHMINYYSKLFLIIVLNSWEELSDVLKSDIASNIYSKSDWSNYKMLSFDNLKKQIIF